MRERELQIERLEQDRGYSPTGNTKNAWNDIRLRSYKRSQSQLQLKAQLSTQVQLLTSEFPSAVRLSSERISTIQDLPAQLDDFCPPPPPHRTSMPPSPLPRKPTLAICKSCMDPPTKPRTSEATNARLTTEVYHLKEKSESVEVLRRRRGGWKPRSLR